MDYAEARSLIEDGDLISVRRKHGFLVFWIRFFTRAPDTHSGIAIWLHDGLWMAELNAGRNHAVPLSQLERTDFDVYYPPVEDRAAIRTAVLDQLRVTVNYGVLALLVIGVLDFFRLDVFVHWRRIMVCSGYCVAAYEKAGWSEHSRMVSPRKLASWLKPKLQVRVDS